MSPASVARPPRIVADDRVVLPCGRAAINKLRLFTSMGVPEGWRCDGQRVFIFILEQDHYHESSSSQALPALTREVLTHFLTENRTMLSPDRFWAVSDWAWERRAASP